MMISGMTGIGSMPKMGGATRMQPPSTDQLISDMDADGDGSLTTTEVKGKLADDFTRVDSDGNGQLTAEELDSALANIRSNMGNMGPPPGEGNGPPPGEGNGPPPGAGKGPPPGGPLSIEELLSLMDEDDDGLLSSNEVEGPLANKFDQVDSDGDGLLSTEELEADLAAVLEQQASRSGSQEASLFFGGLSQSAASGRYSSIVQSLSFQDNNNLLSESLTA
ncbi:MAG: hypothetical protein HQL71_02395 [Magnetococcales bacterium]|nr:hypothetical protein [Magnetococcales bacterium]